MKKASRVDGPQKAIVAGLRKAGRFVQPLNQVGDGCPDLLTAYRGAWYVLEVKDPKGKLSDSQRVWMLQANAPVSVVTSLEEALVATRG